jgi:hypothetical protein
LATIDPPPLKGMRLVLLPSLAPPPVEKNPNRRASGEQPQEKLVDLRFVRRHDDEMFKHFPLNALHTLGRRKSLLIPNG